MSDTKEGNAKAVGTITWTGELEKRFILTAIAKGNPDLALSGWKEIAEDMKPFGQFSANACQKRWTKIRKEYIADRDAAAPNKRKIEATEDNDDEDEEKPKNKTRGKKAAPKKAAPKKASKVAAHKENDAGMKQEEGDYEENDEM